MVINYWQNLNDRERWMIKITGLVVIIYLFYLVIYSPLTNRIESKTALLIEKKETLQWMKGINIRVLNDKAPETLVNSKLLSIIDTQLSANTLKKFPYQLQQTGAGDIQLTFESVPFTQILFWLWTLNKDYLLMIKQAAIERSNTPGLVKFNLTISAASKH